MYQAGPSPAALLAGPMLVINQKLKLIELKNEFRIFDQYGNQVGAAVQASQSPLAFLAREQVTGPRRTNRPQKLSKRTGDPSPL